MLQKCKTMHHQPKLLTITSKFIESTSHMYVKHISYMYFQLHCDCDIKSYDVCFALCRNKKSSRTTFWDER
jgi:hypothetical protein